MRASDPTPSERVHTPESAQRATASPAVLLAGGRSRRFGERDKAFARVDGTPMVRRVADRVAPVTDGLVASGRTEEQAGRLREALAAYPNPVSVVTDPVPDGGPLVGLQAALGATAGEYVLVVACDLPLVSPALVAHLFERAAGKDGAVPRVDGHRQLTYAVYQRRAIRRASARALAADRRSLRAAVEDLDLAVVPERTVASVASAATVHDVDTTADLQRARSALGGE